MKKFLWKLMPFTMFPVTMIIVNYTVDPANLYRKNYELGIANYLSKGYNVTDVINYNERKLQKDFIETMKVAPSEIALGSSRIMELHKAEITDPGFINNGVSGATFEDELAIYQIYEEKGCAIKKVILELDPWMLNDNHQQTRWKTLEKEYHEFTNKLNNKQAFANQKQPLISSDYTSYLELVSFSYFKTSFEYLTRRIDGRYKPTRQVLNVGFTRLTDGSISYDSKYRNASFTEVNNKVEDLISNDPVYSLGEFNVLSTHYKNTFTEFIEYLQKKDIKIEFFLSPFHPVVYNYFKTKKAYRNVFAAENYFRNIAKQYNIKIYGSYNPAVFDLDYTYFHDGLHCNTKALNKILNTATPN